MRRFVRVVLLLSLASPHLALAQRVEPGDLVRVTAPECQLRNQTGVLTSLDHALFVVRVGVEEIRCPSGALTRLDLYSGKPEWWRPGLKGMVIGAAVGAVGGLAIAVDNEYSLLFLGAGFAAVGGGLGFLAGSVVGGFRGRHEWTGIPLPLVQPVLHLTPGGRFGLSVSIPLRR